MNKPSYILGINESHTASAALLKDGEIIAAAAEERFTRKKLQAGIPKGAIKFCLDFAKISPADIDLVAVSDIEPPFLPPFESPYHKFKPPLPILALLLLNLEEKLEALLPPTKKLLILLYKLLISLQLFKRQRARKKNLRKAIGINTDKFVFISHHTSHAASALFSCPQTSSKKAFLVFTCDGVGDFESATIAKYHNGKFKKLVSIDFGQSIGFFYQHVTQFLGFKPIEDEYKVMGLAPYTNTKNARRVYKILKRFFKIDKEKNSWKMTISEYHLWHKLPRLIGYKRFDHIAHAVQIITEEILTEWVKNAIKKFKIANIICSGGVFANIKINLKIAKLKSVKYAYFMPSPGDETNAIGAAYYAYFQKTQTTPKPLTHLYLGPSYQTRDIAKILKSRESKFRVSQPKDINLTVAKLLAGGNVVARFAKRMEFGARALGNRSILASPKDTSIVEFINSAIKNRDFWMPFAPTVLAERAKDYLFAHKADSPFMTVAFDITQKAQEDLVAAIHPRDLTTRPQILEKSANSSYYDLIKKFEKLTGVGAVLNTSFNLHGEPLVCSPHDAIRVFVKSDLKYLILEDWLISKK